MVFLSVIKAHVQYTARQNTNNYNESCHWKLDLISMEIYGVSVFCTCFFNMMDMRKCINKNYARHEIREHVVSKEKHEKGLHHQCS